MDGGQAAGGSKDRFTSLRRMIYQPVEPCIETHPDPVLRRQARILEHHGDEALYFESDPVKIWLGNQTPGDKKTQAFPLLEGKFIRFIARGVTIDRELWWRHDDTSFMA